MEPVIIPSSSEDEDPEVKDYEKPVVRVSSSDDDEGEFFGGLVDDSDLPPKVAPVPVESSSETDSAASAVPTKVTKRKRIYVPPPSDDDAPSSSDDDEKLPPAEEAKAPDVMTLCKELIICEDGYKQMPELTEEQKVKLYKWVFDGDNEWHRSFLTMAHVMKNFHHVATDAMKKASFKHDIVSSSAKKRRKKGKPRANKRIGDFWIKTLITRVKKRKATFKITPNLTKWDVEPLNKGSEQEWDSQNPSLLSPALQSIINTLASTFNKKDQMPGLAEGIVRKKSYTRLSDVTRPAFRRAVRKVHTERYVTVTAKNTAQEATFHLMKTVYGGIHHYKFWVFV